MRSRRAGYFRKLCSGIVGLLGLVVGLSLSLVLFVVSLLGSVLLWFRGLYGVFEWLTQPIEQVRRTKQVPQLLLLPPTECCT